jgi:hypothetical protein
MPTLVRRNDKAIDAMSTEYVRLYAPTTSWEGVVDMNLGYPGIRGYWPMNITDECNVTMDLSEMEHHLIRIPLKCKPD